ncbi:MAG: nucleotidyltransferase domain-containing protein [Nanoarchaeota archaeon]|nr:nucleotidyltransferase domain-containing protein [Nanoarchaeota archaeon]
MLTETKVIKALIENKKLTIREIAKIINADYKITHTAVKRLIEKKIVLKEIIGKSSLCYLCKYDVEVYKAENERREEILKNKNLNQLYKEILNIKTSLFMVILFGSYAKKKETKTSDIDLLFISNDTNFENKVDNILSLIPLKTHVLVFTEEEFIKMKDSKESNVVKEVIENNIILYGIENFYKLKNA